MVMNMERLKALKTDIYRCIHCKACRFAYSGEPSKEGIGLHKGVLYEGMVPSCPAGIEYGWEAYWNAGKVWIARSVLEGELDIKKNGRDIAEVVYPCITCGLCGAQCENNVRTVDIIEALRGAVIEAGLPLMEKHQIMANACCSGLDNPYGMKKEERMNWAKEAGVQDVVDKKGAKVAFFAGCTAAYRQKAVAGATIKILKKIGYDVTVLTEEVCCGSPFLRTGNVTEGQRLMKINLEKFGKFETVIFSCAGCYRTFTIDYPKWSKKPLPFKTTHSIEIIADLVKSGKITFKENAEISGKTVTYHDPCHLGRHMGEYKKETIIEHSKNLMVDSRSIDKAIEEWFEKPRTIIKAIPGIKFNEMYRIKMNSFCCGSGGGVKAQFPEFALKTASRRLDEAGAVGADIVLTECPFCKTNLTDGNNKYNHGLKIMGLLEMIDSFDLIKEIDMNKQAPVEKAKK